jgi:CRISPR-associated protein Csb2
MSDQALIIELRFLNGRYHGVGDWPPSPFRLFQALVAGAYGGRWRNEPREPKDAAFRWLEHLSPPDIASPAGTAGRAATYYVPNNDADTIGGDPLRVPEIRIAKQVQPTLLSDDASILYAWRFADSDGSSNASRLCEIAERLHTCGWGIDAAFASAQVASWEATDARLRRSGPVARPVLTEARCHGTTSNAVRCPTAGSFDSLDNRHRAMSGRLEMRAHGRSVVTLFKQPPKARCRAVAYECPPTRLLFDLCPADNSRPFSPVPQRSAVDLAMAVRDLAVRRLIAAAGEVDSDSVPTEVESALVGRKRPPVDASQRVRFVPLPSIGTRHTDPSIRRVMIEIPSGCAQDAADISWAVSGQYLAGFHPSSFHKISGTPGESLQTVLVPAEDTRMLERYGIVTNSFGTNGPGTNGFRRWRTVTPAALPVRGPQGGRTGSARIDADDQRCREVVDALRHAGFDTRGVRVRVQREPFLHRGLRAEMSTAGRFDKSRLHHVEVTFPDPVPGPVILGDGRWLGLGLMAPIIEPPDSLYVFAVAPRRWHVADGTDLTRALRRAVMARAGQSAPGGRLPTFFSGHEHDGRPAEARHHQHLFYLADDVDGDGYIDRLAIVAPHLADPSSPPDRRSLFQLAKAVTGLKQVRAGALGLVDLDRLTSQSEDNDPLFGRGRIWTSRTGYRPTRHPKRNTDVEESLSVDITRECTRRGLAQPAVQIIETISGPKGGLVAKLQLTFPKPITGPLMLGAESHFGAGVFEVER